MSRTYRRKNEKHEYRWVLRNWDVWPWCSNYTKYDAHSKEGIKALAEFHADWYRSFREPGPAWFRNMFTERPQRREAKRQIKKFMLDKEYEVILNPKDPLEYWT